MLNRKPYSWFMAVLVVLALVAAACGSGNKKTPEAQSGGAGKPVKGGTLIDHQDLANGGDVDHVDPATAGTFDGAQISTLVYDGLTEYDPKAKELKPLVAESWKSNADFTQWTFKIRNGVKWSNGDPVLPSDFKYGWERVLDSKLASEIAYHITDNAKITGSKDVAEGKAKEISGIVADDTAMELKVTLDAPLNIFPNLLSHTVFSPMPKKVVSALTDQTAWENQVMIGNGPFKMAEPWKHDQYIKLVRNDTYFGGFEKHKAYLDGINFVISKDTETAFAGFEAGSAQTADIPPGRYADVRAKYADTNTTSLDTLATYYWGFNMKDPTVGGPANLKLRQAISLAIDRQAIVDTVYSGTRKVATGFTPPGMPGYKANLSDVTKRDVVKAKQLLTEWGKTPPTLRLSFNAGAGHEPVGAIFQSNLKDIGINSTIDARPSKPYFSDMRKGKGQLFRAGWFWDYIAYDNGLFPLFSTAAIGGDNLEQYSNPKLDQMLVDARTAKDEGERNRLYNEAEKIVLDDVAVIPLNWYRGTIVWRPTLKNVQETPLGFLNYESMWMAKAAG